MSLRQNLKLEKVADHESIFLDHYAWLHDRALLLTRGSKDEAEDLVQDLYVRFVFSQSNVDVTDDDQLQGYLFRALQNLSNDRHRSRARDPLSSLQTVDYDSMETALAAADGSRLLYIRSDLAGICEYACSRRRSSRAGSVLILRFFLGYFPSEIAGLLKASRVAVHKLVETSRLEVKAFLKRPASLHIPGQDSKVKASFSKLSLPDDPAALFAWLHSRVFEDKEGECLTPDDLDLIYSDNSARQLTTREVCHLVSCRDCLERANHLLHFPDLSTRFPDDPDDRNSSNPPSSRAFGKRTAEAMRKKLRAAYEHRPKTLEVAVDGQVRGVETITSALSRFQICLKPSANPKYISVLSEQGYCLLYLDLQSQELTGIAPLATKVAFADNRFLALELDHSSHGSVINLTYCDPALEIEDEGLVLEEERQPIIHTEAPEKSQFPARPRVQQRLWQKLVSWLSDPNNQFRVSLCAVVGVVILFALALPWSTRPRMSSHNLPAATALLAQAERTARVAIPAGGASRQTVALEVRNDSGGIIESATIQTLRSRSPERLASRLVGANQRLLAGRWSDERGKVTTYTPKDGVQSQSAAMPIPITVDNAWLHVPEAGSFDHLIGKVDRLHVEQKQNDYELVYRGQESGTSPTLLYADLVLSGPDLHPTSETLRLRDGGVTREYRFRELVYEVLRADQLVQGDFDPDRSLNAPQSSIKINPAAGSSTHLALEALQLLSNLGPDIERTVDVERRRDGTIELSGVFPTAMERNSVVHVFRSLQSGNHLKLDLHASDDAAPVPEEGRSVQLESLAPVAADTQRTPFDSQIRPILSQRGLSGAQLDDRIRQISSHVASHAAMLHREAWSISQIAARDFSLDELRSMPPEDQMLWLTLLEKHIHAFDQELSAVQADLVPFEHGEGVPSAYSSHSPPSLHEASELEAATITLTNDSERLDRLLTTGFTLSPSTPPTNYNFADVGQLMSALDTEEKTLQGTIERLHSFGQAAAEK